MKEQLIEDYKRRLKSANKMLLRLLGEGTAPESVKRIEIKMSCFRTFISELEKLPLSYTEDRVKELEEQVNTWKNIDKRHVETILELSREVEALKGKLEVAEKALNYIESGTYQIKDAIIQNLNSIASKALSQIKQTKP